MQTLYKHNAYGQAPVTHLESVDEGLEAALGLEGGHVQVGDQVNHPHRSRRKLHNTIQAITWLTWWFFTLVGKL